MQVNLKFPVWQFQDKPNNPPQLQFRTILAETATVRDLMSSLYKTNMEKEVTVRHHCLPIPQSTRLTDIGVLEDNGSLSLEFLQFIPINSPVHNLAHCNQNIDEANKLEYPCDQAVDLGKGFNITGSCVVWLVSYTNFVKMLEILASDFWDYLPDACLFTRLRWGKDIRRKTRNEFSITSVTPVFHTSAKNVLEMGRSRLEFTSIDYSFYLDPSLTLAHMMNGLKFV